MSILTHYGFSLVFTWTIRHFTLCLLRSRSKSNPSIAYYVFAFAHQYAFLILRLRRFFLISRRGALAPRFLRFFYQIRIVLVPETCFPLHAQVSTAVGWERLEKISLTRGGPSLILLRRSH